MFQEPARDVVHGQTYFDTDFTIEVYSQKYTQSTILRNCVLR